MTGAGQARVAPGLAAIPWRLGLWAWSCALLGCTSSDGPCGAGGPTTVVRDATADALPSPRLGPASVLTEHRHPSRDGAYVEPAFTHAAVKTLHVDPGFKGAYDGLSYGEPLFLDGLRPGQDALIVASWTNHVTALDARTGDVLWDRTLGTVVSPASLACGQPTTSFYGILATPVVDPETRTLYVESFQEECGSHFVHALSIDDGRSRPGWPVNLGSALPGFVPGLHHARGGLLLFGGRVYAAFSGLLFDCDEYHGWVAGIRTTDPSDVTVFTTRVGRGGIWGGMATDGADLFFSTGNGDVGPSTWEGQEAVFRLPPNLAFTGDPSRYFVPSNWAYLDANDFDLGSSTVVLFDLPASRPSRVLAALGKGGILHLLDPSNLGGMGRGNGKTGEGLTSGVVSLDIDGIKGRLTSYVTARGRYLVARTNGHGVGCPEPGEFDLLGVRMEDGSPPGFTMAWCAHSLGLGSPISTTTDGARDPIVWIVAAQANGHLLGFDGDTGAKVFEGGSEADVPTGTWRFASPIVAKGRIYVAGLDRVFAFEP